MLSLIDRVTLICLFVILMISLCVFSAAKRTIARAPAEDMSLVIRR